MSTQGENSLFGQAEAGSYWRELLTHQGILSKVTRLFRARSFTPDPDRRYGVTAWDKAVVDGSAAMVKFIIRLFDRNGKFEFPEGQELRLEELLNRPIYTTGIQAIMMVALFRNQEIVKSLSEAIKNGEDLRHAGDEARLLMAKAMQTVAEEKVAFFPGTNFSSIGIVEIYETNR